MSYITYQEAKIAMPLACIIHDTDKNRFFGMPSREGTTLTNDGCKFAEASDYCMTVEKFIEDGHKLVKGDVILNAGGGVITLQQRDVAGDWNCDNRHELDNKRYILRAAALKNQMNIDKLETQAVEEYQWVNGDRCAFDNRTGVFVGLSKNKRLAVIEIDNDKMPHDVDLVKVCDLSKPETPEAKEKRERLEAAYDLYLIDFESSGHESFNYNQFCKDDYMRNFWLAIVDKTNYRKGVK